MMKTLILEFDSNTKNRWSIFKVTNKSPNQKSKKRSYYFVTSQYEDPEEAKTRIRAMLKSKTIRGGAKQIAGDMAHDKDYEHHFTVKKIAKGLSRERAEEIRNRLKGKTPRKMMYNKPRS